jgi:hypothetical protein
VRWGLQTSIIIDWGYKRSKKIHVSKRRQITIATKLLKLDEHKISQIEEAPRRCVTFLKVCNMKLYQIMWDYNLLLYEITKSGRLQEICNYKEFLKG